MGTARDFDAPVLIRLDSERSFTGSVDRVMTGTLEVPSGVVEVPPGTYRVEVQYFNLELIGDDGIEGDDRYMITLTRAED